MGRVMMRFLRFAQYSYFVCFLVTLFDLEMFFDVILGSALFVTHKQCYLISRLRIFDKVGGIGIVSVIGYEYEQTVHHILWVREL